MRDEMYALLAAGTACLFAATSASATLNPGRYACGSNKLSAAAKYAQCRLGADAKAAKLGMSPDYSKCSLDKFAALDDRVGVDGCASGEDQALVQGYLDDCTSHAANWLAAGAGTLTDTCKSDLASCQSDCSAIVPSLLQTGQTTSYGADTDGDLQRGAARSFTDNGDGTITDNATGLMWEKKSDDGSIHDKDDRYTWSTGSGYMDGTIVTTFLATLNGGSGFAGHTDWRIPNRNELVSITNLESQVPATFGEFNNGCTAGCTVTTCSCIVGSSWSQIFPYWTSTRAEEMRTAAWLVGFLTGDSNYDMQVNPYGVRAVRAGH